MGYKSDSDERMSAGDIQYINNHRGHYKVVFCNICRIFGCPLFERNGFDPCQYYSQSLQSFPYLALERIAWFENPQWRN
jgi:hypothetical protein